MLLIPLPHHLLLLCSCKWWMQANGGGPGVVTSQPLDLGRKNQRHHVSVIHWTWPTKFKETIPLYLAIKLLSQWWIWYDESEIEMPVHREESGDWWIISGSIWKICIDALNIANYTFRNIKFKDRNKIKQMRQIIDHRN